MFFFFPYATDAPIYHRPIATIGLIVANILVFLAVGGGPTEQNAHLWLAWGDGLHPLQWLSSNFVHGDFFHLAGNMIFLWVFGLVVEGKIGWWRFLACYLGVGVGQAMVEQVLTLSLQGANVRSGGASSAIFGIMAMAAIWAPVNEITCGYFAGLGWMIRTGTFDVTIGLWAAGFVGLNLLQLLWGSMTGLLHLMGAALGAPLAILLLKTGFVDCEGWDAFTIQRNGRPSYSSELEKRREYVREVAGRRERDEEVRTGRRDEFRRLLAAGDATGAQAVRRSNAGADGSFPLERDELFQLAQGLDAAMAWADAAAVMEEAIGQYPFGTDAMRIRLATILAGRLDRPQRALDVLDGIDPEMLSAEEGPLAERVFRKAREMIAKRPPAP
ncbi:MAG: rhomboid family intramembrane serine protease [Planctomycetia bacterium]